MTMDDSIRDSPVIFEEEEELSIVEEEEDPAMSMESRNMTQYQRTVLYAIHLQQLGLSKEAIIRNEDAMTLLYGVPPPISYKEHVVALNKELLREYRISTSRHSTWDWAPPNWKEALSKLQRQKAEWKSYMYTALQKALCDIRSYSFDQCTGWTPSPKQAKRTGEECTQRTVMDSNLDNSD